MWSFCSLRYIISYTCVKWGHMRGMGGGWGWHRPWLAHRSNDGGPEKTLASVCCPGKQHAIIAGRGGRDMHGTHPHTHYTYPHNIHTHTIYIPTQYTHCDMKCLLCSPPALPPSCSEHCTRIKNLMCVCVCVCTMPSSLTLSTSYSVVRPMLNNLRELLPPVPHNTPDLQAIRQRHCYQVFHLAWATS